MMCEEVEEEYKVPSTSDLAAALLGHTDPQSIKGWD